MISKQPANIAIKEYNRKNIFRMFCEYPALSKQDIVHELGVSLPTVTQNLIELSQNGWITESGQLKNTGGRSARTYSLCRRAKTAIGLDITRNHITAVAVDLCGDVISTSRIKYAFECTDEYFQQLGSVVDQIIQDGCLEPENILGVGISLPALVTADNESVFYGDILSITGLSRAKISKYIQYPTMLFNDANAAAFAERWKNRELDNAFYIMLSNNVGGAIILNGEVYVGNNFRSGEVGHMTIVPDGKLCYCGQRGCMDQYCSATRLSELSGGDLEEFFNLLAAGNEQATARWNEYLNHLATAINNVQMLFDCQIVLGGYVGGYIESHITELQGLLAKRHSFKADGSYLQPCIYKRNALAAGAALNFVRKFIDAI